MLTSYQIMELTKKLISEGVCDTVEWISSYPDEQCMAYLQNTYTQSKSIDLEMLYCTKLYHGTKKMFKIPNPLEFKSAKDFGKAFYCTQLFDQAKKWATKHLTKGYTNYYRVVKSEVELKIISFGDCSIEWLDFIAKCRTDIPHGYDIVEGPMADDQIYDYVRDYLNRNITSEEFLVLAKFRKPTHQIAFCTDKALSCLRYAGREECLP